MIGYGDNARKHGYYNKLVMYNIRTGKTTANRHIIIKFIIRNVKRHICPLTLTFDPKINHLLDMTNLHVKYEDRDKPFGLQTDQPTDQR